MQRLRFHILIPALIFHAGTAMGQFKVRGTVYDSSYLKPLIAVSVMSSGGKFTTTDERGQYVIDVTETDSVWFSYLEKPTRKYPVSKMYDINRFDIALNTYNSVLDEVKIIKRSYRMDSLQNRIDYAKAFNFRRPNLQSMTSIGPMGAGIDINELIRVFQFRKNRSMEKFRERLLQQERDKFVDFRFNKNLVRRLTDLDSLELEEFMIIYRPSYEMILLTSDYEFQAYIRKSFANYRKRKSF